MRALRIVIVVAVAVMLAPGLLWAQTDLSGTWNLSSTMFLPDIGTPCEYSGQATLTQDGPDIFGTAEQTLSSGPGGCPAEMSASLSGTFNVGRQQVLLTGVLDGGKVFGMASFTGSISRASGGNGSISVTSGPFAGVGGTWLARLAQAPGIPAVTPIGLTVLVLLLLAGGGLMLRRMQPEGA